MPHGCLVGCAACRYGNPRRHAWFQQYEDKGDYTMRYFIEPVALAAGYAKSLGYKHVVMMGLSGGGWTTTVASSVVTDIELSFPVAGSMPKWPTTTYPKWVPDLPEGHNQKAVSPNLFVPPPVIGAGKCPWLRQHPRAARCIHARAMPAASTPAAFPTPTVPQRRRRCRARPFCHPATDWPLAAPLPHRPVSSAASGGDYEQMQARPMYSVAEGFLQMYVMAGLEPDRHQLQIVHEYDSCCFRGAGLFSEIKEYNAYVQGQVKGWMQTAVTAGNYHEVNPRDKVLIALLVEKLRRKGKLDSTDFMFLPFDDLQVQ